MKSEKPTISYPAHFGCVVAAHLFASMVDPANRGPRFTWANFPALAAGRARVDLCMSYTDSSPPGPEEISDAAESARDFAAQLVKTARMQDATRPDQGILSVGSDRAPGR